MSVVDGLGDGPVVRIVESDGMGEEVEAAMNHWQWRVMNPTSGLSTGTSEISTGFLCRLLPYRSGEYSVLNSEDILTQVVVLVNLSVDLTGSVDDGSMVTVAYQAADLGGGHV